MKNSELTIQNENAVLPNSYLLNDIVSPLVTSVSKAPGGPSGFREFRRFLQFNTRHWSDHELGNAHSWCDCEVVASVINQ